MFNGQLLWTWIASLPENKIIISFLCVCIHWYGYEKVDWFIFLSRNVSKWLILYKYIYIFIKKHRREQREAWIFFNSQSFKHCIFISIAKQYLYVIASISFIAHKTLFYVNPVASRGNSPVCLLYVMMM